MKQEAVSYASLSAVQFSLPFVETYLEKEKQSYDNDNTFRQGDIDDSKDENFVIEMLMVILIIMIIMIMTMMII